MATTPASSSRANGRAPTNSKPASAAPKSAKRKASTGPAKARPKFASLAHLPTSTFGRLSAVAAVGAGIASAGYFAWREYKARTADAGPFAPAAFAPGETDIENFDQTRSAGPESMRDEIDEWDRVDQAADESFPASDPTTH